MDVSDDKMKSEKPIDTVVDNPMTQERALIAILIQQRNAAMDGLAQVSALAEMQRASAAALEAENKPLKARVAELEQQLRDFAGEQPR